MEIVLLLMGIAIGAGSAFFILRHKFESDRGIPKSDFDKISTDLAVAREERGRIEERARLLESNLGQANEDLAEERKKQVSLSSSLATAETELRNANRKLADQKTDLESIQEKFSAEFKNLANHILEEKTKKFTQLNKEN